MVGGCPYRDSKSHSKNEAQAYVIAFHEVFVLLDSRHFKIGFASLRKIHKDRGGEGRGGRRGQVCPARQSADFLTYFALRRIYS
jgi:hypothetical protein